MTFQRNSMLEIKNLNSQLDAFNIETNTWKSFFLDQIYIIDKSIEDLKISGPSERDTFWTLVDGFLVKIQFLKEENQNKTTILKC